MKGVSGGGVSGGGNITEQFGSESELSLQAAGLLYSFEFQITQNVNSYNIVMCVPSSL